MKQLGFFSQCRSHQDQTHRSACSPCSMSRPTSSISCLCLRIAVGQNIVQTQYVSSIAQHISQDPLQKTARLVHHYASLLQVPCIADAMGKETMPRGILFASYKQHSSLHRWAQRQQLVCLLQIFLCTDLWKDAKTLHAAYCDSQGVTEAFIKNGMTHALHAVGVGAQAAPACWLYDVVINPVDRRVRNQTS